MVMLEYVLESLTAARGLKEVNGEDCTMEHPFLQLQIVSGNVRNSFTKQFCGTENVVSTNANV